MSSTVAHLRSTFNYGRTVALPKAAVIAGAVWAQLHMDDLREHKKEALRRAA